MLRVYHPSESDQQYASDERTGQPSEGEALGTSDSSRVPPPGLEIMKVRTGQRIDLAFRFWRFVFRCCNYKKTARF
jgi:hypothetical protein